VKVVVGRVGKPHGLDGAFVVEQASEEPERFVVGARFLVEGDEAEIVEAKRAGGRPVIRLDRSVRRGAALEVDRESLPDLGPDNYYVADLVGCTVEREDDVRLGIVAQVHDLPANAVIELDNGLLLPLVDACVREVDLAARRILVAPGFDLPD
jgi:16S rRNA processing protein RimM